MSEQDHIRLDVWLWCTRFAKTRSLCTKAVTENSIRINGQRTNKPHAKIRVGDILTLPVYANQLDIRVIEVTALPARRVCAALVNHYYKEMV